MKKIIVLISFLILHCPFLIAQWSTSTIAESTLYVCPGFYPGIVTFDDGSSIILGALQSYIFAQKLDEYGYKQWTNPVQVHHNDSSDITSTPNYDQYWGGWISDGDGGVIIFWYDHRGAYFDPNDGYKNNAIYAQRVDKFGDLLWGQGVKVKGVETGMKDGRIVNDGQGGFILVYGDRGFDYPGAPNTNYLKLVRFNNEGQQVWETYIDSGSVISPYYIFRGGQRLYFSYYLTGNNYSRIIDLDGNIITTRLPVIGISTEGDSIAYLYYSSPQFVFNKINANGDTIWTATFERPNGCTSVGGLLPDGFNGIYVLYACNDTIFYIDSVGIVSKKYFQGISFGGRGYGDGNHGIVLASVSQAKRYNQFGQMVWNSTVTFLQNPSDAYFRLFEPDNNGGVIATFWTTRGGIFVQHTGRNGHVGIINSVNESVNEFPIFYLKQNYPNPFNSSTIIEYNLPTRSRIELTIFDLLGRQIKTLVDKENDGGTYKVYFENSELSSGIYIYRMTINNKQNFSKRMILLR